MNTLAILERLVAFPTVSRTPNIELIEYAQELLESHGVECQRVEAQDGHNANLYAHLGPRDRPGIMLSGHTDVVPVAGQQWSVDPFTLTQQDGRLYGRGTADMKGFVACAISALLKASSRDLSVPLQLALSYDEEIGCVGVRRLLDILEASPYRTAYALVGEPTGLMIAIGHKGKTAMRATCSGREIHSALAPNGFNAIHLGADLINILRHHQAELCDHGASDSDYDVPYSTIHAGVIAGGIALNIVPRECFIDFEIRNLQADDALEILQRIRVDAERIVAKARESCEEADIQIEIVNSYPGLDTPPDADVVKFVQSLTGANSTCKVAFGTEGGLIHERLGLDTVVCGPGSMDQGHKPDEFITLNQLHRCDALMDALIEKLAAGKLKSCLTKS